MYVYAFSSLKILNATIVFAQGMKKNTNHRLATNSTEKKNPLNSTVLLKNHNNI